MTSLKEEKVDVKKPDDDERIFFPHMCEEYVGSVQWMISRRLLELSIWDSVPPIHIYVEDIYWGRERADYTSMPLYKCHPKIFFTMPLQAGMFYNVISCLSTCRDGLRRIGNTNHRVEPESLKGKYVLLFCVLVPAKWSEYDARHLSHLAMLSHHLSLVNNFEIVIVPKMRKQWEDDAEAFQKLLSPFFGRLVVPFSDRANRDRICHFLNFTGRLTALLVGPDLKVLQDNVEDIWLNHDIVAKEGVPYFLPKPSPPPKDEQPCLSLASLLNAKEGDPTFLLHNLNSNQTISVAQLSKKLVGLYLFQVGNILNSIHEVYMQCKDKGLEFEIVLVATPLFSSIPPLLFQSVVLSEVKKHIPNTSWWVLPYDHSTCVRLFNISGRYGEEDRMLTVGPDTRFFVDEWGGEVVHHFGIEAYPFNREVIVQRYVDSSKAVTVESLLTFGSINYLVRNGERVPVSSLRGMNVLLYVDNSIGGNYVIYNNLVMWYNRSRKVLHSLFALVFVYSGTELMNNSFPDEMSETEALVRPFDPEYSCFIRTHPAFFRRQGPTEKPVNGIDTSALLGFGKDGHLVSIRPMNFRTGNLDTGLFNPKYGRLREEILDEISYEFRFMGIYQAQKPFDVVSLTGS